MIWLVVFSFITVHAPDGQEIEVNVAEISTIRSPQKEAGEHFAGGTKCIVVMSNGKFIGVTEPCLEVIKRIAEVEKAK